MVFAAAGGRPGLGRPWPGPNKEKGRAEALPALLSPYAASSSRNFAVIGFAVSS